MPWSDSQLSLHASGDLWNFKTNIYSNTLFYIVISEQQNYTLHTHKMYFTVTNFLITLLHFGNYIKQVIVCYAGHAWTKFTELKIKHRCLSLICNRHSKIFSRLDCYKLLAVELRIKIIKCSITWPLNLDQINWIIFFKWRIDTKLLFAMFQILHIVGSNLFVTHLPSVGSL